MAFKKVLYTISNSHPKLVVKNYFASTAAQKFTDFSSTFEDLRCFQALSRALNFKNRIQALSRISRALYEPCQGIWTELRSVMNRQHAIAYNYIAYSRSNAICLHLLSNFVLSTCVELNHIMTHQKVDIDAKQWRNFQHKLWPLYVHSCASRMTWRSSVAVWCCSHRVTDNIAQKLSAQYIIITVSSLLSTTSTNHTSKYKFLQLKMHKGAHEWICANEFGHIRTNP